MEVHAQAGLWSLATSLSAQHLTQNLACVSLPRSVRQESGALQDGVVVAGQAPQMKAFLQLGGDWRWIWGVRERPKLGTFPSPPVPCADPPWGLAGQTAAPRVPLSPGVHPMAERGSSEDAVFRAALANSYKPGEKQKWK